MKFRRRFVFLCLGLFTFLARISLGAATNDIRDGFEGGIDATQWSGLGLGTVVLKATNYAGSASGSNSLWIGGSGSRLIATQPVDASAGAEVRFWLRFAQGFSTNWETVDLAEEGVVLEYSTNNVNWTVQGRYVTTNFYGWVQVNETLPVLTNAFQMRFRWRQLSHSGPDFDHWALDDVEVRPNPLPPRIFFPLRGGYFTEGMSPTLAVGVAGTEPFYFQWRLNGLDITNATNAILQLSGITTNTSGEYSVLVTNAHGNVLQSTRVTVVLADDHFRIVSLLTNDARVITATSLTGDDRSGIGLTANSVFYTGDSSTAVFSANDLSQGRALGRIYDGMISDLRVGRLYHISDGTNLIATGTVRDLVEVDDLGNITADKITLSTPIPLAANSGFFSGYGRMMIYTSGNLWLIRLPSGVVTNLGSFPMPARAVSESGTFWGVLEHVENAHSLVYVQQREAIVRTTIPGVISSVVGAFTNLSDMSTLIVSPFHQRWYFELEGLSQFGGGTNETVGYAAAALEFAGNQSPPRILTQPADLLVQTGRTAVVTATVFGTQPLTYQWFKNNLPVPGATNLTLRLEGLSSSNAASYRLVASNSLGVAISGDANVRVTSDRVVWVFDDHNFVDTFFPSSGESDNVQTALAAIPGIQPQAVTNFARVLPSASVLLIPELEIGDLGSRLSDPDAQGLRDFVSDGGILIVHGSASAPFNAIYLLNRVFGYSLVVDNTLPAVSYHRTTAVVGTSFSNSPPTLVSLETFAALAVERLPAGTRNLYEFSGDSAAAMIPYGGGRIIYLAWDWYGPPNAPWNAVLANAVAPQPAPSLAPIIFSQPANQQVIPGENVVVMVGVEGASQLYYQWRFNGVPLFSQTNATLRLDRFSTNDAGGYSVVVSNQFGTVTSSSAFLVVTDEPTLATATDMPETVWTTLSTAPWLIETNVTLDGRFSVRSGYIWHSQQSWLETRVTGPGTISFWWRVSSEGCCDSLSFQINGGSQNSIRGETPFTFVSHHIGAGVAVLRWTYGKDGSVVSGLDAGFVDRVSFIQDAAMPAYFVWNVPGTSHGVNESFPASLTAYTSSNTVASNYDGSIILSGNIAIGPSTNRNFNPNIVAESTATGNTTVGYKFVPNTDLLVTHLRHFFGTKVSIWTEEGTLLVAQNVVSSPGAWTVTPLQRPVMLRGGLPYRVAASTGQGSYFWREALPNNFPDGNIVGTVSTNGDAFPSAVSSNRWYFVDLLYQVEQLSPIGVQPFTANMQDGQWNGFITIVDAASNLFLEATVNGSIYGRSGLLQIGTSPAIFRSLLPTPGRGMELVVEGTPGQLYQVEVSSNLTHWSIFSQVTLTSRVSRAQDTNQLRDKRFYRLRLVP